MHEPSAFWDRQFGSELVVIVITLPVDVLEEVLVELFALFPVDPITQSVPESIYPW